MMKEDDIYNGKSGKKKKPGQYISHDDDEASLTGFDEISEDGPTENLDAIMDLDGDNIEDLLDDEDSESLILLTHDDDEDSDELYNEESYQGSEKPEARRSEDPDLFLPSEDPDRPRLVELNKPSKHRYTDRPTRTELEVDGEGSLDQTIDDIGGIVETDEGQIDGIEEQSEDLFDVVDEKQELVKPSSNFKIREEHAKLIANQFSLFINGYLKREKEEAEFHNIKLTETYAEFGGDVCLYFVVKNTINKQKYPFFVGVKLLYDEGNEGVENYHNFKEMFRELTVNITFETPEEGRTWGVVRSTKQDNYRRDLPEEHTTGFYDERPGAGDDGTNLFSYYAKLSIIRRPDEKLGEFSYNVETEAPEFIREVYKLAKTLGLHKGKLSEETCEDKNYNVREDSKSTRLMRILNRKK